MNNYRINACIFLVLIFATANSALLQAAARPDVSVSLYTDSDTAILDSVITLALAADNKGPTPAKQVKATIQLPSNATLLSYSPGCKFISKRARKKLQLTCKTRRLDPVLLESNVEQEYNKKIWTIVLSADQLGLLSISAKVTAIGRDYQPKNNTTSKQIKVEEKPIIKETKMDACGCPTDTLWHPEMNHCMAVQLCELPEYKGQCQTGDQCIACSKNGIPARPRPGGICP